MTWTYVLGSLGTSNLFQVRYLVGDTDTNDQQIQDEEINFALTQRTNIYGAAAMVCRAYASYLSRQADVVDKDLRSSFSQRAASYNRRASDYETQASVRAGAMPYAGGISISDKNLQTQNSDRLAPQFNLGMTDNLSDPEGPIGNETPAPLPS